MLGIKGQTRGGGDITPKWSWGLWWGMGSQKVRRENHGQDAVAVAAAAGGSKRRQSDEKKYFSRLWTSVFLEFLWLTELTQELKGKRSWARSSPGVQKRAQERGREPRVILLSLVELFPCIKYFQFAHWFPCNLRLKIIWRFLTSSI